jgi:D-alanine--poly(phosphoribitol) ligase subunit 2
LCAWWKNKKLYKENEMQQIIEKIKPLVEEITFKTVTNSEALYTSSLIDSMGTVDLALMLEDEFNIKIDTRDIIESNFDSIEKLASYIEKRINE